MERCACVYWWPSECGKPVVSIGLDDVYVMLLLLQFRIVFRTFIWIWKCRCGMRLTFRYYAAHRAKHEMRESKNWSRIKIVILFFNHVSGYVFHVCRGWNILYWSVEGESLGISINPSILWFFFFFIFRRQKMHFKHSLHISSDPTLMFSAQFIWRSLQIWSQYIQYNPIRIFNKQMVPLKFKTYDPSINNEIVQICPFENEI